MFEALSRSRTRAGCGGFSESKWINADQAPADLERTTVQEEEGVFYPEGSYPTYPDPQPQAKTLYNLSADELVAKLTLIKETR